MTAVATLGDFTAGDSVYCLAWVGKQFEVVAADEQMVSLQAAADSMPYGAQIDIFPETAWMVTREHRDQIWQWPDRAGERYLDVFDRFLETHRPGDLVLGFHFAGGLDGFTVRPDPARAMTFRVRSLDRATGQIRVHPVVALGDDGAVISDLRPEIPHGAWARSGPTVPLRMEMRMYRWCLCFGEFVVNWQDLRSGPGQRPRSTT